MKEICPDLEMERGTKEMAWILSQRELSPDQKKAVELPLEQNQLIIGPPGSGKTQILVHRAYYLCKKYAAQTPDFRIFVFTNSLKKYIKDGIDWMGLPEKKVMTFDSWCREYHTQHISASLPRGDSKYDEIRQAVLNHTKTMRLPLYDFVMVDEGQDLNEECFEILRHISRHVTVCCDNRQQLYSGGADQNSIMQKLQIGAANVSLLKGFRCSPYIVTLAKEFITDSKQRTNFGRELNVAETERQTPLLYYASDIADEQNRLYEIIQERLLQNEKMGALFPTNAKAHSWAKHMVSKGLSVENPDTIDFASAQPKFMTYHSAKGLSFDSIFLPGLTTGSFSGPGASGKVNNLLFVGITRARKWAYLSTRGNNYLDCLKNFQSLADREELTIQRYGTIIRSSNTGVQQTNGNFEFDL